MTSVPHGFGQVLRDHRVAAGLTQESLAERAGLSVRGLSDLDRGLRHNPRLETVRRLTDALAFQGEARAGFEASARRASPSRLIPHQPHSASARSTLNLPGAALAMPLEARRGSSRPACLVRTPNRS